MYASASHLGSETDVVVYFDYSFAWLSKPLWISLFHDTLHVSVLLLVQVFFGKKYHRGQKLQEEKRDSRVTFKKDQSKNVIRFM